MEILIAFIAGVLFGAILVLVINYFHQKKARELEDRARDSFRSLSVEALRVLVDQAGKELSHYTQMGEKDLESKKELIDQTLEGMKTDLNRIKDLIRDFENDRTLKFGQLESQLNEALKQTRRLEETTSQLHQALASTKVRGQWGERMAEDILRLMGFVEGYNYEKQKSADTAAGRPDYTFLLPQNRKINMDVKFPLDNYLRYLEASSEVERENHSQQFIKDVRSRIKEVITRDYINPEDNTLDYVLVFIPNEQVYAFINEKDPTVLDEALKKKVILCSPITLYAVLAIIRQAMENFNLQNTAGQILNLLEAFYKQWQAFVKSLEKMGRKIKEAQDEFDKLNSTRKTQLERPLQQIENIKKQCQPGLLESGEIMTEAEVVEAEAEIEELDQENSDKD
jgi:DNA recombination protein RmuC